MNFGEIFEAHAAFVFRSLRHLGVRDADLPDCAQEAFLVAYEKRGQLRKASGIRSWLYRICFHIARNHQRRAHVRRERPMDSPALGSSPSVPVDPVEQGQLQQRLLSILDALDEDKRAVLVAHSIEEMTVREIAEALDLPQKTVYSRLYAARRVARAAWERSEVRDGQ